jgi:hypothetical protein
MRIAALSSIHTLSIINLESINALDHLIFSKPAGVSAQSYARLRFARMQALFGENVDNSIGVYQQIFRHTEYELRLSLIGIAEVRTVFLRLAGPVVGVMAKAGVAGWIVCDKTSVNDVPNIHCTINC